MPFLNRDFGFAILHWSGNKDFFIDTFTRLHRGNAKNSELSFKNFMDIPSKPGALDVSRLDKIFLVVANVALYSSMFQSYGIFSYVHVTLFCPTIDKFDGCDWQLLL